MTRPHAALAAAAIAATLLATVAAAQSKKSPLPLDNGVSITAPGVCITDVDCPKWQYCKRGADRVDRCTARLPNGAKCETTSNCRVNSFCFVDVVPRCRPQGTLNAACSPVQANACRPGLTCTPPSPDDCIPAPACSGPAAGRCKPSNPGRAGARCRFDRDCAQDAGFYCKGEAACARKRPVGADCNNASDNLECAGFCASGFSALTGRARTTNGVCAAAVPLGGKCTEDRQCASTFLPRADRDSVRCNRPRADEPGRCALVSKLLRRLGAPCARRADMCDARRGLSCRWAAAQRRTVCQQVFDRLDSSFQTNTFCTRGSALSRCPGPNQFYATECRKTRRLPGSPFPDFEDAYTRCERRRRVIAVGQSCDIERDVCPRGSVCMVVAGVRLPDPGYRPRFGPQPAVFCVRALPRGAKCSAAAKFRAQCAAGLACRAGKCAPASASGSAPSGPATHANIGARCGDLPCAPGFVCDQKTKLCARPAGKAGFRAECDDGGVFAPRCRGALVCRTRWGPVGPKRCGWRTGIGSFCETDNWCKRGLECGANDGEPRCRAKLTKPLWRGQRCDPRKELTEMRCATVRIADGPPPSMSTRQLTCLKPARGMPKCQVGVEPFGMCGAANVQCDDPRFVCRLNVCVPRN